MAVTPPSPQPNAGPAAEAEAAAAAAVGADATTGASVVRGGLWMVLSNTLPQIYALVISIAAARYLGPNGMGRQSFIAFVELATIEILSSGFSNSLMRNIGETAGAQRLGEGRWLAFAIFRLELLAAALGAGGFFLAAGLGQTPPAAWVLAGLATASGVLASVPGAVLTGLQRWRAATVAGLAMGGFGTVATIAVLSLGGGITGMFAVEATTLFGGLVWTSVLAARAIRSLAARATPSRTLWRSALRFSAYWTAGQFVYLIVWRRSEFFFLNHYSPNSQIAFYSIAFALVAALVRIPAAMGQVLAPAVATLLGAGAHERIRTGFSRALRLILLTTMPIAAAAAALGPEAIRLIWGRSYDGAVPPFLIMVATSLVTPLTVLGGALVSGLGHVGVPLMANAAAAAVDVGLAFLLIPSHAAVGAAITNAVAQLAAGVPLIVYGARVVGPIRWEPAVLVRMAVVSAVSGGTAWAVVDSLGGVGGLVTGLLAGIVVFFVLGSVARVLTQEDGAWLADVLGPTARGVPRRLALRLAGVDGRTIS